MILSSELKHNSRVILELIRILVLRHVLYIFLYDKVLTLCNFIVGTKCKYLKGTLQPPGRTKKMDSTLDALLKSIPLLLQRSLTNKSGFQL